MLFNKNPKLFISPFSIIAATRLQVSTLGHALSQTGKFSSLQLRLHNMYF